MDLNLCLDLDLNLKLNLDLGLDLDLEHLGTSGSIWEKLAASGSIWEHLATSGSIWEHLGASGDIWEHLGESGSKSLFFIDFVETVDKMIKKPSNTKYCRHFLKNSNFSWDVLQFVEIRRKQ